MDEEEEVVGGQGYNSSALDFLASQLSGGGNNDVTAGTIYGGYDSQRDLAAYYADKGGVDTRAYDMLFANQNEQLLKGNYQGSQVGSVPIFGPKSFNSPVPFLIYRRDSLRAAAAAKRKKAMAPQPTKFYNTANPYFNDNLNTLSESNMKYWINFARDYQERTGEDGWEYLNSGKNEDSIAYRRSLANLDVVARKFDYVTALAADALKREEQGYYSPSGLGDTYRKIIAGFSEFENSIYMNDYNLLFDLVGQQVNFDKVFFERLDKIQGEIRQTVAADPELSGQDWLVAYKTVLEKNYPEDMLTTIANEMIRSHKDLAERQDITVENLVGDMKAYLGGVYQESMQAYSEPRPNVQNVTIEAKDRSDASSTLASNIKNLYSSDSFDKVYEDGYSIKRSGNYVFFNIKGVQRITYLGNTDEIAQNFAEVLARDSNLAGIDSEETVSNVKNNLFSGEGANLAGLNQVPVSTAEFNDAKGIMTEFSKGTNDEYRKNPFAATDAFAGKMKTSLMPIVGSGGAFYIANQTVHGTDEDGRQTIENTIYYDGKTMKGVVIPASVLPSGNNLRATADNFYNAITDKSVAITDIGGGMLFIEGYHYTSWEGGQYHIQNENGTLEFSKNEKVNVPMKTVRGYAYSSMKQMTSATEGFVNEEGKPSTYGARKTMILDFPNYYGDKPVTGVPVDMTKLTALVEVLTEDGEAPELKKLWDGYLSGDVNADMNLTKYLNNYFEVHRKEDTIKEFVRLNTKSAE